MLLLLKAVSTLGMVELGNNRVSDGVFPASTGDFRLSLATFVDITDLGYTPSTWKNKLTMYFRLKSLHLYSLHASGIVFEDRTHSSAWSILSRWVENQDRLLEENWITTRFGNTELWKLLHDMLQEAYKGKCIHSCCLFCYLDNTESSYISKVACSTWKSWVDRRRYMHGCESTKYKRSSLWDLATKM